MRILVTNDDGIDSAGLHCLAGSLQALGDVVVVAPDTEYSGSSAALGALNQLQPEVHRRDLDDGTEAWAVNGPPALCVLFARLGMFGGPFDLVVAGVNPGANVGRAVYHSGTVGAVLTARHGGLSGVAVSQAVRDFGVEGQGWDEMLDGQLWESAGSVGAQVARSLLDHRPPQPVVVNVNVPNLPLAEVGGWRATRLGEVPLRSMLTSQLEPKAGHPGSYRVRMRWGEPVSLPADTDGGTVERGWVSVTLLGSLEEQDPAATPQIGEALDDLLG